MPLARLTFLILSSTWVARSNSRHSVIHHPHLPHLPMKQSRIRRAISYLAQRARESKTRNHRRYIVNNQQRLRRALTLAPGRTRQALLAIALGTIVFAPASAQNTSSDARDWSNLALWYKQPAAQWNHALPVGNGRLGAMIFGETATERIQLNEETFWAGGPYDPTNPGGAAHYRKFSDCFSLEMSKRRTTCSVGR